MVALSPSVHDQRPGNRLAPGHDQLPVPETDSTNLEGPVTSFKRALYIEGSRIRSSKTIEMNKNKREGPRVLDTGEPQPHNLKCIYDH